MSALSKYVFILSEEIQCAHVKKYNKCNNEDLFSFSKDEKIVLYIVIIKLKKKNIQNNS